MFGKLANGFSKHERDVLFAEDAWQNGHRLPQILHLAEHLGAQIERNYDLLMSMVSNCEVGKKARLTGSVTA